MCFKPMIHREPEPQRQLIRLNGYLLMKYLVLLVVLLISSLSSAGLQALPAMEAPLDRARKSDIVIHATVRNNTEYRLNSVVNAVQIGIEVHSVLKDSADFDASGLRALNFMVSPRSFESGMREPPGPGQWIIFLNLKSTDVDGRKVIIPVLYEPAVFSFEEYSSELAEEIKKLP